VSEHLVPERPVPEPSAARYGEVPLRQTSAAAGALRRLAGVLLTLEHPHPVVDELVVQCAEWETLLAADAPPDPTPRMGSDGPERRVYLGRAFDIGSFNPVFPEYAFDRIGEQAASGRVAFPLVFEGPPGLVHGGMLAVFFDCVTQHQNCALALTGKTRSLEVTYQAPTPILTDLTFDIVRTQQDRAITSTARLLHGDRVLCTGVVRTVARRPDQLSTYEFGRRTPQPDSGRDAG
jgi:hypothetical protein